MTALLQPGMCRRAAETGGLTNTYYLQARQPRSPLS